MEKVVENKVFNRRPPMFSDIHLRKRQQCCNPKIGGEPPVTNKLSSEQARIKFGTGQCVKEVLCDITPTNSCHLVLRWAWLHFKTVNLDERSLYLRHEGHEMKLKFMTPRQAKMDQHTFKDKIEKERMEKEEI